MQCILFGQKKKARRLWDLECGFLSCLPAKKLTASPGYQEDAVEARETMTWNHNCVFLIVWMGRKGERSPFLRLSGWAGERVRSSPENCRRYRTYRALEENLCDCTNTRTHPTRTLGWQPGSADKEAFHFPSQPLKNTRQICSRSEAHTYLKGEVCFLFGFCFVWGIFFFFLLVRHTQAHTLLRQSE